MRVPRAGAALPFVHHQTRRFRSGNFFSVWTESGGCPSNLCKHPVNFARVFCRARFFLHLVPHMQYFVFNILHYVRKWMSSVHWIEHATSIHVHVASYCHDQCYTVITGRKSKCRRQRPNWKIQAWQVTIVDGHGPSERKIYFWKFGRGRCNVENERYGKKRIGSWTDGQILDRTWIWTECFWGEKQNKGTQTQVSTDTWTELSSIRYVRIYIAVDRITDIGSDRLTVLHVHSKRAILFCLSVRVLELPRLLEQRVNARESCSTSWGCPTSWVCSGRWNIVWTRYEPTCTYPILQ